MSRPIDEKIVKMSLDNKDFERKANGTMSIFAKLQQKFSGAKNLNLSGTTKSLNDVGAAANRISLKSLISGTAEAGSRFTAMGAVAVGALMKIGASAVTAGASVLKSFSLDPITSGFAEYEEKMNAIQVILSNTEGKSNLDDVKNSLADLNDYADKTIYSFADMTKNMGTFTAAGVDLETAQTAIKGIGNLAAVSGSNTQQAGTAMYQLSQAIAGGKVNLQDWNSVVNAGMGGKKFQDALKANAQGFWDGADASLTFRDSLQEGWLTTEVLMKTLDQFAKDDAMLEAATKVRTFTQLVDTAQEALQSGWATTWELIFGDFKESGDMWTQIGDAILGPIEKSANARNQLLKDFNELGGRASVVEAIKNAFQGLTQIIGIVSHAFRQVFPKKTAEDFANLAKGLAEMSKNWKLNAEGANKVNNVFRGLFSIISIGITVVKTIGRAILDMFPDNAGSSVLDFAEKIALMIVKFDEGLKSSDGFKKAVEKVTGTIKKLATAIWDGATKITNFLKNIKQAGDTIVKFVSPAFKKLAEYVGKFIDSISGQDVANVGVIGSLLLAAKKLSSVQNVFEGFLDNFSGLFGAIKGGIENLGGLKDVLSDLQTSIKAATLMQIAVAVGLLAGSLKLLSTIDGRDMAKSLEAMGLTLLGLVGTLKLISKIDLSGMSSIKAATSLVGLGAAVLVISAALKVFASMKPDELARGMLTLVGVVATLTTAIAAMSKFGGKINTSSLSLIALASSVVILSQAVKTLSKINGSDLPKALGSLAAIMASLAAFLKIVNGAKFSPASAVSVVILGGAILVMVEGIKQIASIPVDIIQKGLLTIGALLLELGVFVRLANGTNVVTAGAGIVLVAKAIQMLVPPMFALGTMKMETLAQGLIAMGIALGEVVVAMRLASTAGAGAAAILAVAAAMNVLIPPIKALSSMTWGELAKGLLGLAGALGIVVAAGALAGPLAPGLLALSIAITAVGAAATAVGFALAGFVAALTTLATIGVGGIATVVSALGLLLDGVIKLIPKLVELGVTIVTNLAKGLADAAPSLFNSALQLILGFLTALKDNVPKIVEVGLQLITQLIQALNDNLPQLVEAGVQMMITFTNGLADGLRENQGQIVAAAMNLIEAILEAMITGLQAILGVLFDWIPGFSDAAGKVGDAARSKLRDVFSSENIAEIGKNGSAGFVNGVNSKAGDANKAGKNVADNAKGGAGSIAFGGTGLAAGSQYTNALGSKAGDARSKGKNVADNAKGGAGGVNFNNTGLTAGSQYSNALGSKAGDARSKGKNVANQGKSGAGSVNLSGTGSSAGGQYASGLSGKAGSSNNAGKTLGNNAKSGARIDLYNEGSNAGSGFAQGISSWANNVATSAWNMAVNAKNAIAKALDSHSPSRETRKLGRYGGQGFALGFKDETQNVGLASGSLANRALETIKGYGALIHDALDENLDYNPTITPVLDLSNVARGGLGKLGGAVSLAGGITPDSAGVVVNVDNSGMEGKFNELIDAFRTYAAQELVVVLDIDGKQVTKQIANPMKQALQAMDDHRSIITTGRKAT